MRFRVKLDVRLPLKRKKKLIFEGGNEGHTFFQYERLILFCFLCGKLGHEEGFCPIRKTIGVQEATFGWGSSLRAPTREELRTGSKWLREEGLNEARWNFMINRMDIDSQKRDLAHDGNDDYDNVSQQKNETLDDNPIEVGDGKKRQRTRFVQEREGVVEREVIQINERSAVAIPRADRA